MKKSLGMLIALALFVTRAAFADGGSHKRVRGTVEKIEGNVIHLSVEGEKDIDVSTTAETKYRVGKKPGSASDVKAGMRVVVHWAPDTASVAEVEMAEAEKSEPAAHGEKMAKAKPGSSMAGMEGMEGEKGMKGMESKAGMGGMDGMDHSKPMLEMDGMDHSKPMLGMFGPYPMTREASGTSWQPDETPMEGIHGMSGLWSTMTHGFANVIHDHQAGPRGGNKTFSTSMFMVMGQRPLGGGTFGLRGMISLDALMGKSGYPLLFQTGESADGRTLLIDRQHPHDLFMELAATYSRPLSNDSSAFLYVGLPGEPALGPPAFMHRFSGMGNPEAPLGHHWIDSTHVTFGVVTLGYVWRDLKVESSVFNGREPDQNRYNMETRKLDSASARLSWNPSPAWSLQVSHGRLDSPEALEPDVSVHRTSASASYQYNFGDNRTQTTLVWGRNRNEPGETSDAWLLESEWKLGDKNTLFGRAERVEKDELFREGEPLFGRTYTVGKLSLGAIRDFADLGYGNFGVGGLVSRYEMPSELKSTYGGSPTSYMLFVRIRLEEKSSR